MTNDTQHWCWLELGIHEESRISSKKDFLKAAYYTILVHNFNLQEKTTSTVEVTTNFVKKFKAHFEKKLLY